MMLEVRDDDLIVLLHVTASPRLGDQIYALGRAAHEDDALGRGRVDEGAHLAACALVGIGRTRGERMRAAVNVGVLVLVEERDAIDDALRLLRRRTVVEPHKRAAV